MRTRKQSRKFGLRPPLEFDKGHYVIIEITTKLGGKEPVSETEAPVGTDDEVEEVEEADQVVAEATKEQLAAAETEVDKAIASGQITNGRDRLRALAAAIIALDEEEATAEARQRLGLMDRRVTEPDKTKEEEAKEHRREQYPEWWDEYREAVEARRIKPTQTAKIEFFLRKGMLVKDVAKMLLVRYQIVYQVASFNELAGPPEGTPQCQVCGRPLTQPNSKVRGTGPICAKGGKHK
jgi:hypothetical protein